MVMAHVTPLLEHALHLCAVIDAGDLDSGTTAAQCIAESSDEGAGVEEHAADTDAATRPRHALGDIEVDGRTAPRRKEHLDRRRRPRVGELDRARTERPAVADLAPGPQVVKVTRVGCGQR